MKYRHKKTGVIIDVPSEMSGVWEAVEPPKPAPTPKKTPAKKKKE